MSGSPPLQMFEMFIPFQKRHKADNETNRRKVEVLKNGSWDAVRWRDVEVGDVVKVHNDSFFPADMVLLSSRYVFLISVNATTLKFYPLYKVLLHIKGTNKRAAFFIICKLSWQPENLLTSVWQKQEN